MLGVPGSHRLAKALPMSAPQMPRKDDVQCPADRFLGKLTKKIGGGVVPDPNHPFAICVPSGASSTMRLNSSRLSVLDIPVLSSATGPVRFLGQFLHRLERCRFLLLTQQSVNRRVQDVLFLLVVCEEGPE